MRTLLSVLPGLLDVLFPCRCIGCGSGGGPLCQPCRLDTVVSPRRRDPSPRPPGAPPVFAATAYAGLARRAVLGYKERRLLGVEPWLAELLAAAVVAAASASLPVAGTRPERLVLVPVPSSREAVRRRGFDHTARLARRAAARLAAEGVPICVAPALRHNRRVADQHALDAAARARNLTYALAARRPGRLRGPMILVDDVVTTGATVTEAARALREAGAHVVAAAAPAATERWATDRRHPGGGSRAGDRAAGPAWPLRGTAHRLGELDRDPLPG